MKTLTITVPDTVNPNEARWEMARALYEKGEITLEQAAELVELTPTYFMIRLRQPFDSTSDRVKQNLQSEAKPFDREKFDQLIDQLDIQESWSELVDQIGK
ncbi:UPF0175 family protein [Spirosoma spitsbergense]|uniref:UPF0175 family protein n=1 Tax=Spirosoma spitsbergense TaxID=431554 RepID=UPI0003789800|nr:UPF0175 family protein [Spirosoma spitsbergense]